MIACNEVDFYHVCEGAGSCTAWPKRKKSELSFFPCTYILIAFSIIYELTPEEQTSHPINSKFPIRRDPLANQIPTGIVFIDKFNNNLLLRGSLSQIMENANLIEACESIHQQSPSHFLG